MCADAATAAYRSPAASPAFHRPNLSLTPPSRDFDAPNACQRGRYGHPEAILRKFLGSPGRQHPGAATPATPAASSRGIGLAVVGSTRRITPRRASLTRERHAPTHRGCSQRSALLCGHAVRIQNGPRSDSLLLASGHGAADDCPLRNSGMVFGFSAGSHSPRGNKCYSNFFYNSFPAGCPLRNLGPIFGFSARPRRRNYYHNFCVVIIGLHSRGFGDQVVITAGSLRRCLCGRASAHRVGRRHRVSAREAAIATGTFSSSCADVVSLPLLSTSRALVY
jgi:hypothetical protein